MKNVREKLISLLGLCSNDDTEATKLQLKMSIVQSADYSKIIESTALTKVYDDLYECSKLDELSIEELKERKSLLHKILVTNEMLLQSINSGNAPELTSEDMPDFTSSKSIAKLYDRIHLSKSVENYSNITEDNAFEVFSETTIKSAKECFDILPVSITKKESIDEATIMQHMGDRLYCINIAEFQECHENFLKFAEDMEAKIEEEEFRNKKHMLLKIVIIMLCFGAIFACSQFGLFTGTATIILTLVMLIIAILFFIWG